MFTLNSPVIKKTLYSKLENISQEELQEWKRQPFQVGSCYTYMHSPCTDMHTQPYHLFIQPQAHHSTGHIYDYSHEYMCIHGLTYMAINKHITYIPTSTCTHVPTHTYAITNSHSYTCTHIHTHECVHIHTCKNTVTDKSCNDS